jgi:hypothetical protein
MTNRNFEDIDKLFREGLNPGEDQFTTADADWSKLKNRLDQNEKKKRGVIWLSRLSGVAAIILLFFVIRMLLPEIQKDNIQQAAVQLKEIKVKEDQNQSKVPPETKKTISKPESFPKTLLAQNKGVEKRLPKKYHEFQSSEKDTSHEKTLDLENLSTQNAATAKTATTNTQSNNKEKLNDSEPERVKIKEPKQSPDEGSLFAENEKPNVESIPEHQSRKLALSVLAASDFNGVNNLNNASAGNDFGLLVTLKISKNWSLSTGGIYAKKVYETGFSNYNPTKNIWDEYFPKTVNADCRVLDIPLNISYTVLSRKKTTISIGSGISSYIMLREDYRFNYVEKDNNTALGYREVNENKHWLSVLNFQAIFEQRLNSRLSIGLQPYMKIPISNIGFAGVKLQTLGVAVVLNWNFN